MLRRSASLLAAVSQYPLTSTGVALAAAAAIPMLVAAWRALGREDCLRAAIRAHPVRREAPAAAGGGAAGVEEAGADAGDDDAVLVAAAAPPPLRCRTAVTDGGEGRR